MNSGTSALEYLQSVWSSNPFGSDAARAHSSYSGATSGELVRLLETAPVSPFARVAHAAFRTFVLDERFSCLGAKAAIRRGTYRVGVYESLADPAVSEGLARDLYAFAEERRGFEGDFTTFVAIFRDRSIAGEAAFEEQLWRQLELLHALDRPHHSWDERVSDDPHDGDFSFSIAGQAFFIVGMHPLATRSARRFAWPTLVFNAHEQFENLRDKGQFAGLQRQIRSRETELDGSINANLANFGERSEARQYSGRPVEDDWACPFSRRP